MNCTLVIIMVGGMYTPLVRVNFDRAKTQKRQKISLKLVYELLLYTCEQGKMDIFGLEQALPYWEP